MKKNNLPGKCQKRFTAIFVSVMIFSLISGTVSAAETEMTKQSTESETQTSEAEPFQSSTELPVEEETEAPVETPTEAITETPVETPTEVITEAPVETPTEAITEAPVETPTEVITEDFVAVPNENETEMKESNGDENETSTEPDTESEDSIVMELSGINAVYHPGSRGQWNPDTHCYENATSGQWDYEEGEGKVSFTNTGNEDVTLILSYKPSESHKEITGVFKDQKGESVQELSISAGNTATVYLNLYGEPDPGINGEVIGTVSYEQAG